jgi:NTP pyrophosphatase (non-canonical NTP hydrolase)
MTGHMAATGHVLVGTGAKSIAEMTAEVVANNKAHGWHDSPPSLPECMMMLVTEAAEAVEAWRVFGTEDATALHLPEGKPGKPEGLGSELADILIRLLDDAYLFGVDLDAEFARKMAYNRTRPFRHGNKRI